MFSAKEKSEVDYGFFDEPNRKRKRPSDHSVGWWWPLVVIGVGSFIYYLIYLNDDILPDFVPQESLELNPRQFCGECSRAISRRMTNLGPRTVGEPANEVETPRILVEELTRVKNGASSNQFINITVQKSSGAYYLEYKPPMTNVYDDIQNVLARLDGSEGKHSILVNCHYDTVTTAPGAADDIISCSAMIEALRVLSLRPERLKHNIVLLFNGAEEVSLMASHMFLSHPWAKDCRLFVNLEGAGIGGRLILFQSGPNYPWMFKYYVKSAPYMHGQILGEEMFQDGIIPSDTDFRIFRDFGKMPGMDFAFWRNGYVYHTTRDNEGNTPIGSHQYLGDNLVVILEQLANAPEVNNMNENVDGKMVYYDYLGWFMIYYTETVSIVLNSLVIVLGAASIGIFAFRAIYYDNENHWSLLIEFGIALAAVLLAMGLAVAVPVVLALIIDAAGTYAMAWYSNPMLVVPFYWMPSVAAYLLVPCLINIWRSKVTDMSSAMMCQIYLLAMQVPFMLLMIVLLAAGLRSAAVLFLPLLSSAVANIMIHATPLYRRAYSWIFTYVALHIPTLLFTMYIVLMVNMFFLPIFARSGSGNNDLVLGSITSVCVLYVTSFAIPLILMVKKPGIIMGAMALVSFIVIIVALSVDDLKYPYSEMRPQRHYIMHTNRQFINQTSHIVREESGFFIYSNDRNSIRTFPIDESSFKSLKEDCDTELFCGLPMYTSRTTRHSPTSHWLSAGKPTLPSPSEIELKNKNCNQTQMTCELMLNLKGPDRMTLTIAGRPGASLIGWTLPTTVNETSEYQGRPSYMVHMVRTSNKDKEVTLTFSVTSEQINGAPIADVGLTGNFIHHVEYRTDEYRTFLNNIPPKSNTEGWISSYKQYIF